MATTIQAYRTGNFFSEHRVYFDLDKNLTYKQLQNSIHPNKKLEYKGAGVRCYGSFYGAFLHLFRYATKVSIDGKLFYLNNKSFTNYIIRKCETRKILAHKLLNRESLRNLFQGLENGQVEKALGNIQKNENEKLEAFQESVLRIDDLYKRLTKENYHTKKSVDILNVLKESRSIPDTETFFSISQALEEAATHERPAPEVNDAEPQLNPEASAVE